MHRTCEWVLPEYNFLGETQIDLESRELALRNSYNWLKTDLSKILLTIGKIDIGR
jgi:hypothetical protein